MTKFKKKTFVNVYKNNISNLINISIL